MITVTLYYRQDCPRCDEVLDDLQALQAVSPHRLVKIDIDRDAALQQQYGESVPVVQVGPYRLKSTFTRQDLQVALNAAEERRDYLEQTDEQYRQRVKRGQQLSGTDRFTYWISRHYMAVFNLLVFIYVGLPFLAPTLMEVGQAGPARVIYAVYSPLCHQLAFRSWFLFGEQPYYPRALSHVPVNLTYEQLTQQTSIDLLAARQFIGNETVGYKVALCERDVAIYGAILLFGLLFAVTGRRLRSIPWYIWIVVGLVPIGLDGVSQLPSLAGVVLPFSLPMRESTPLLRSLTGGLFGFTTAWYMYPLIEETMRETRMMITHKMALKEQSPSGTTI